MKKPSKEKVLGYLFSFVLIMALFSPLVFTENIYATRVAGMATFFLFLLKGFIMPLLLTPLVFMEMDSVSKFEKKYKSLINSGETKLHKIRLELLREEFVKLKKLDLHKKVKNTILGTTITVAVIIGMTLSGHYVMTGITMLSVMWTFAIVSWLEECGKTTDSLVEQTEQFLSTAVEEEEPVKSTAEAVNGRT